MGNTKSSALRVLIVDDNQDAADSLADLLGMLHYSVRVAYDAFAAVSIAREFEPDCMLADIRMPLLDGYGLARQVRADPVLGRMKLVALSAYSDDDHVRRAEEAGFDYRLTKGCELDKVLEVLKMIEEIKTLARQNIELAGQTKELLREVKEDVREVKQEVKELKKEVKELRESKEGEGKQ